MTSQESAHRTDHSDRLGLVVVATWRTRRSAMRLPAIRDLLRVPHCGQHHLEQLSPSIQARATQSVFATASGASPLPKQRRVVRDIWAARFRQVGSLH